MIEIKNVAVMNLDNAIRGMRNPLNSWDKSDSTYVDDEFNLGEKDLQLAMNLQRGGQPHRKFLRQIFVSMDITAPMYWWKEMDTYKVGTVANSTSTMHKIHSKEITLNDFSCDRMTDEAKQCLEQTVTMCNVLRAKFLETKDKKYWYSLIQLLPSSYNQTRTVTMNYESLSVMYEWRHNHKLDEWRAFCKCVKELPYAKELIIGVPKKEIDLLKMATDKLEK